MSGRIIFTPPPAHTCEGLPDPAKHPSGTIWECNDCKMQWVVVSGQGEDGEGYTKWRVLTEHNRSGNDY